MLHRFAGASQGEVLLKNGTPGETPACGYDRGVLLWASGALAGMKRRRTNFKARHGQLDGAFSAV
jgi:hypothetical protein